jgi:hypothetical protein
MIIFFLNFIKFLIDKLKTLYMEAVNTSGKTQLNFLRDIDQRGNVIAEYIWIDGALGMRAKCRTLA